MSRMMNERKADGWVGAFPAELLSLMREIGELKRLRSAGQVGSFAERLFSNGWSRLGGGVSPVDALGKCVFDALRGTRLGDIDAAVMRDLGMAEAEVDRILERASSDAAGAIDPSLAMILRRKQSKLRTALPDFARLLARQPRAGVTCPGRPRLIFEPAENHAEHCAIVAVYGVLLSPLFGADPLTVWLASMAHHFHNAFLPDSGFTGEVLLGSALEPVMRCATERCLSELSPALSARVENALAILPDASTREGRAFHAADTLDRVWQIDQHLRTGRIGLDVVLGEMALVHEGPAKPFQDDVLRAAGLAA